MNEQTTDTREEVAGGIATWKLTEGSMLERSIASGAVYVSYSDYAKLEAACKKAEAANKEKDYEVERLKGCVENLDRQLASLRASVGEKWIGVKQKMPPEGTSVFVVWNGTVQHSPYFWENGEWVPIIGDSDNVPDGIFSHWMTYKLPAPPTKDKE